MTVVRSGRGGQRTRQQRIHDQAESAPIQLTKSTIPIRLRVCCPPTKRCVILDHHGLLPVHIKEKASETLDQAELPAKPTLEERVSACICQTKQ